jgi:hypothetical protein
LFRIVPKLVSVSVSVVSIRNYVVSEDTLSWRLGLPNYRKLEILGAPLPPFGVPSTVAEAEVRKQRCSLAIPRKNTATNW